MEKGGFTLLSREECGKLKPEELAGAFAKFVPCSEPNTVSHEGPQAQDIAASERREKAER